MEKRYHVLHIDDDIFIRKIVQQTLSVEFKLTSAVNGVEAMTWLEEGNVPDIILTDLKMPLLNGQEVIALVRSSSLYYNIPIVVLSSMEDTALKATYIDQGADDFVVKPFSPMELKARIKALLRRTNERRTEWPTADSARLGPFQR